MAGYRESKELMKMRATTKDHWETIQQWRIDEGKNFAKSRTDAITRMGASGLKPGSEMWKANLANIDAANATEKASQQGSATQGILDRWTKTMKDFYIEATKSKTVKSQAGKNNDSVTRKVKTAEGSALAKYGGNNPYRDSGLSEAEFKNISTDEFMKLSFGISDAGEKQLTADEEAAAAGVVDESRRSKAQAQQQQASPWWA